MTGRSCRNENGYTSQFKAHYLLVKMHANWDEDEAKLLVNQIDAQALM